MNKTNKNNTLQNARKIYDNKIKNQHAERKRKNRHARSNFNPIQGGRTD